MYNTTLIVVEFYITKVIFTTESHLLHQASCSNRWMDKLRKYSSQINTYITQRTGLGC